MNKKINLLLLPLIFIVLGKLIFLFIFGPFYEYDTPRYLLGVRNVFFPPLYPLFLRICLFFTNQIYFVLMCQAVLFGFLISIALHFLQISEKNLRSFSILIALEPISSFYVSNLMSEWLFLAILVVIWAIWQKTTSSTSLKFGFFLGFLCLLLYLTRFVGEIFLYASLGSLLFYPNLKYRIKQIFIAFLAFFLLQIPLKWNYYQAFGYFQIQAFNGFNLWNNASVLFPDSKIASNPKTDLEKYLVNCAPEEFSVEHALLTQTIWNDHFTAIKYRELKSLTAQQMNDSLNQLAKNLIKERPLEYLSRWILPNIKKAFVTTEIFEMKETRPFIENIFNYRTKVMINYQKEYFWFFVFLLISAIIFASWTKNREFILVLSWILLYSLGLFVFTAVFQRYFLVILSFLTLIFLYYVLFQMIRDQITLR